MKVKINSPNVQYLEQHIESVYDYHFNRAEVTGDTMVVTPVCERMVIRTNTAVPRVGVMLVGWGGNNGSTFTAAVLANRSALSWQTRKGTQEANWLGSITQCSTVQLAEGHYIRLADILPTIDVNDIEIDGWDISALNLGEALDRAQVLEPSLRDKLRPLMKNMKPRPGIFIPEFIAENQCKRADNVLDGSLLDQVKVIMNDIREFKEASNVNVVIVFWTGNTECCVDVVPGVNDTYEHLKSVIENSCSSYQQGQCIAPSTLYAYAAILTGCTYINGSPQNTFVPAIIEMASHYGVCIAGDDLKTGQTKFKSVLADFLSSAGIRLRSIVSYNHLGNNDGANLSGYKQFQSKERSKKGVIDDIIEANPILYGKRIASDGAFKTNTTDVPLDHIVSIVYVPFVGDSKRAIDEYSSDILMGGTNTVMVYNMCEDSLLAVPIMLDLVVLAELCGRIQIKRCGDQQNHFENLCPILSTLAYFCKAPIAPAGAPVVNALFKQRSCIENLLKACLGLQPDNNIQLEYKIPSMLSKSGIP